MAFDLASAKDDSGGFDLSSAYDPDEKSPRRDDFSRMEEPTFVDRAALATDKVLTNLGEAMPDFLPSRQDIVNLAGGMSEMGGLLRNSPRAQNAGVQQDAGWTTAGRVLDPVANTVGAKVFQGAALGGRLLDLSKNASRIFAGGASGGTVGAMNGTPVEGAAIGMALPPAFQALGNLGMKAYATARNLAAGAEGNAINYLHKVFGGDQARVADALESLKGFLPGERPTAGLAAVSTGQPITALKSLETGARSRIPQEFNVIDDANAAARAKPLDEMADPGRRYFDRATGTTPPSELEAIRSQMADPLYVMAGKDRVPLSPEINALLQGPEMQSAVRRGTGGFQQGQINAGSGAIPGMRLGVPTPQATPLGGMPDAPFMPDHGDIPVQQLMLVKAELSKQIDGLKNAVDSAGRERLGRLLDARSQLDGQMRAASGGYGVATDIYRNASLPIHQADAAETLLQALRSPSGAEREAAFLTARQNSAQTVRKATGDNRFASVEDLFGGDKTRQILDPLGKSVRREADYARLPAPQGSLPELASTLTKVEGASVPWFSPIVTASRHVAKQLGMNTDDAAQMIIDKATTDPKALATLLKQIPPKDRGEAMQYFFQKMRDASNSNSVMGVAAGQSAQMVGQE